MHAADCVVCQPNGYQSTLCVTSAGAGTEQVGQCAPCSSRCDPGWYEADGCNERSNRRCEFMDVATKPYWAAPKMGRKMTDGWGLWQDNQAQLVKNLTKMTTKKEGWPRGIPGKLDFVLFGDSISTFHYAYDVTGVNGSSVPWQTYLGEFNAIPMALAGDYIGNILWRLWQRGEKPAMDPSVFAIQIGINDCNFVPATSIDRMKFLFRWVWANMPRSTVLLYGMTPVQDNQTNATIQCNKFDVGYVDVVNKLALAGMDVHLIRPWESITRSDGTAEPGTVVGVHPTYESHVIELKYLRQLLDYILPFKVNIGVIDIPPNFGDNSTDPAGNN